MRGSPIVIVVKPLFMIIGLFLAGNHIKVGGLKVHGLVHTDP